MRRGNMKTSTWIKAYWTYDHKTNMWTHPAGPDHGRCTDEYLKYLERNKK